MENCQFYRPVLHEGECGIAGVNVWHRSWKSCSQSIMKKIYLLCCVLLWLTFEPVKAQATKPQSKVPTIASEEAFKHIGSVVKLNCEVYTSADHGQTLFINMNTKRPERLLTLTLTGEARKKTLTEMRIRRELNRQIKSPLDTSITATGKIVLYNGYLQMLVSHASDIYLGADLNVQ